MVMADNEQRDRAESRASMRDVHSPALSTTRGVAPSSDTVPDPPRPEEGTAAPHSHADESTNAAADKGLRERFDDLRDDELARLSILRPDTQLEQGAVYLDLDDLDRGPFKAIGGEKTRPGQHVLAKRESDYLLWNRLAGQSTSPEIDRPETDSGDSGQ